MATTEEAPASSRQPTLLLTLTNSALGHLRVWQPLHCKTHSWSCSHFYRQALANNWQFINHCTDFCWEHLMVAADSLDLLTELTDWGLTQERTCWDPLHRCEHNVNSHWAHFCVVFFPHKQAFERELHTWHRIHDLFQHLSFSLAFHSYYEESS